MARNEEKANAMLNRFLAMKAEERNGPKQKRPYLASMCDNLVQAEKWRLEIVREVGKKVTLIQNASWGEFRLREMNDEINKLLREKHHWERHIRKLGGADYTLAGKGVEGEELAGSGGYMYFGAAKDLPGVRELLEKSKAKQVKRKRGEMVEHVDCDYYGFRDEDDGTLVPAERAAEERVREAMLQDWEERQNKAPKQPKRSGGKSNGTARTAEDEVEVEAFVSHVPLPNPEDIEKAVLEQKKKDLLAKYASNSLQEQEEEAKRLLNIAGK